MMLVPLLTLLVVNAATTVEGVRDEFLSIYEELVRLSQLGINVDDLVKDLSMALELINDGSGESLTKAKSILEDVRRRLEVVRSKANYEVIYKNLIKYSSVAILALIPLATYYLLPRAYLRIWFMVRRRWVVKHGHT
ncbi:MAG: hypothetical protein NZ911_03030 [Sulfolobales archaeon]|nr:hypothetical protein [Sulfolobales archaeon]